MRAASSMRSTGQNSGTLAVRGVPWWGVVSSAAAPVLLVAGWTIAARLQPRSFNAVTGTVSALAAVGAAERWVMTLAFAVVGACEVVTGLALRPASSPGRLILMAGGVVGMLVAASPQHAGGSRAHAVWAVAGFAALVAWPAGAWRRGRWVPWGLRPTVCAAASAVLLCLLAWFGVELAAGGGHVGLAERVLGVAQAAFNDSITYAQQRSTFGKPIAQHQAIQLKLADMATKIEAARLLLQQAAQKKDRGERCDLEAGMTKLSATEICQEVTLEAMRIYGGFGYTKEFNVERYYRDAPFMLVGEGTSEIQRLVIARQLLERYRI